MMYVKEILFFGAALLLMGRSIAQAEESAGSFSAADAGRLAAETSEELRNEALRLQLSKGAWTWKLRAYFPKISFSISEDDRLSMVSPDSFVKKYSVNVDQLLWDGGRIAASRKLESAELELAETSLKQKAGKISDAASAAYRQVLFYRKVLEIRINTLESLNEQRKILAREIELGLALSQDLASADITVAEAEIEINLLSLDLEEAECMLAESLGLEALPVLSDEIDAERESCLPSPGLISSLAETRNPDIKAAKNKVICRQVEAQYAARSWLPAVHLTGSAGLSGRQYPLNKFNWSIGLSVEFSSPWISGSAGASTGWEPPYDRTARFQSSAVPLADPGTSFNAKTAELMLGLEKENYDLFFRRLGRTAEQAVEKCALLDKKRSLAVAALELETERYHLSEKKMELGKLTRIELMNARLDYAAKEAAAVEAAAAVLEAERELENFLDLEPGELQAIAKWDYNTRGGSL